MFTYDGPRRDSLSTDLYQITMAAGYFDNDATERVSVFELFVRKFPGERGYLIACGIDDALTYLENLTFSPEEIAFLKSQPVFAGVSEGFWDYLASFRFTGSVWAVAEGTPIFPGEPILRICAPVIEAQLVETYLLSAVNFETLIATKAARVVDAAKGRAVVDFGTRRAHGPEAALRAARAGYVGGCTGTSNVLAGFRMGLPVFGTFAHSWVMSYEDELQAFTDYQRVFPNHTTLLVDTYDTVAAVRRALDEMEQPFGGIRLDSGDLGQLARDVRPILDAAGKTDVTIIASGDLNEYKIDALVREEAPINVFGVGTELVTSRDAPALGGVYKLVEQTEPSGDVTYKIKLSKSKATYPGSKQVYRTMNGDFYVGDVIALADEEPPGDAQPLLREYMNDGKRCLESPPPEKIRDYCLGEVGRLPAGVRKFTEADPYSVTRSEKLDGLFEELKSKQESRT